MPRKRCFYRSGLSKPARKAIRGNFQVSHACGLSLPVCEGPKLGLFEDHRYRIDWYKRLGIEDADDSDNSDYNTADRYVFRAVINNKDYAIKVVSIKC